MTPEAFVLIVPRISCPKCHAGLKGHLDHTHEQVNLTCSRVALEVSFELIEDVDDPAPFIQDYLSRTCPGPRGGSNG